MNKIMKNIWAGLVCSLTVISSLQAGWTPVITVDDARVGTNSQYTPSNSLLVTWTDDPFGASNIEAAFLSPLGILSTPVLLGNGVRSTSSVNPVTGDAVAVWRGNGSPDTVEASTYNAVSGIWTHAILDTANGFGKNLSVSYDPTSNVAVAVWFLDDGDTQSFKAAKFSSGTWSSPVLFTVSLFTSLFDLDYSTPKNGPFAGAMYTYQDVDTFYYLQVGTYSAQTDSWVAETPKLLPFASFGSTIAISNSGQIATMVPVQDTFFNTNLTVWGTGQTAVQMIANVDSTNFLLSVDNAGRAYAVWNTLFDTVVNGSIFLFATPSSWSPVGSLTIPAAGISSISPDAGGNLSVALTNDTDLSTQETTFTGSWSPILTVSDVISSNRLGTNGIASNPAGAVLLSWANQNTDTNEFAIQEVHKPAGGSFTPFFTIIDGLEGVNTQSFISNPGNKAIIGQLDVVSFASSNKLRALLPTMYLTVFVEDVVVGPNPPTNFIGQGGKNKFLTQTERFNGLTWTASTTPTVVNYLLFRNGQLIAVIPASGPLLYVDHNRNKHVTDTYTLYAVDASGAQSAPATVVVR